MCSFFATLTGKPALPVDRPSGLVSPPGDRATFYMNTSINWMQGLTYFYEFKVFFHHFTTD
jgi:hypothetical protein